MYFSESKSDFLTSQVQLGGYESPVLVRRSQLKNSTRSAVDQCIDQSSLGTEAYQFSPFRGTLFSIELEFNSPVSASSPQLSRLPQTPAVVLAPSFAPRIIHHLNSIQLQIITSSPNSEMMGNTKARSEAST